MKLDERSPVTQHLLNVLLAEAEKLPAYTRADPRDFLLGFAALMGDLLGTLPPGMRDDLLLEALRITAQRATKTKTRVREVFITRSSEAKH